MKRTGNTASNRLYNPRNVRPVVPFDPDMVDSAMERYIRQKYQHRTLSTTQPTTKHDTGSTTSTDDHPPPPPPKPMARFAPNLRSASATFPLSQREKELPSPFAFNGSRRNVVHSPISSGRVSFDDDHSFDSKMSLLKDMGFHDEKKNTAILKGHDGNIDKAVDSLNRLGEREPRFNQSQPHIRPQNAPRALTDLPPTMLKPMAVPTSSLRMTEVPLQSQNPHNPFEVQSTTSAAQQAPLELNMQAMYISPQPLFPHNTGAWYQAPQTNPFMKNFTPPMSPAPHQYHPNPGQQIFAVQNQPQGSQVPVNTNTYNNPFYLVAQQSSPAPNGVNQPQYAQPPSSRAPITYGHTAPVHPFFNPQQPEQNVGFPEPNQAPNQAQHIPFPNTFSSPQTQTSNQNYNSSAVQQPNAYGNNMNTWQQQQQQQPGDPYLAYQQPSQANFRMDKGSILALYNQPPSTLPSTPVTDSDIPSASQVNPLPHQPQRSVTMPASLSTASAQRTNPFASFVTSASPNAGAATTGMSNTGHVRKESKEFSGVSMTNGRHSPDAFANLSARFV